MFVRVMNAPLRMLLEMVKGFVYLLCVSVDKLHFKHLSVFLKFVLRYFSPKQDSFNNSSIDNINKIPKICNHKINI